MTTEQNFESRLLAELRAVVAERPEPVGSRPPAHRWGVALPGAGVAVAAAGVAAVVIATSGDAPSAAYGVEARADGSVSVTIRRASDAEGLERRLRAAGVPADVSYDAAGPACPAPVPRLKRDIAEAVRTAPQPPGTATSPAASLDVRFDREGGGMTFRVDPDVIPAGWRLVVATSDANVGSVGVAIAPPGGTDIVCGIPPARPPAGAP